MKKQRLKNDASFSGDRVDCVSGVGAEGGGLGSIVLCCELCCMTALKGRFSRLARANTSTRLDVITGPWISLIGAFQLISGQPNA